MYSSNETLSDRLLEANLAMEQAEVILTNLLRLYDCNSAKFTLPNDDIVVSVRAAIQLLSVHN